MANCLNCGKEVKQTPGRRQRQYCDNNCRQKKWQADHKKVAPPSDAEIKAAAAAKNRKAEEKKAPAEKKINPPPARKTYQDYLREAEMTTTPITFREEVRADSSLGPNQRSAIYARIKK